jgi:hypothetical protein
VLLQMSTCAAIRDVRLLCQVMKINTEIEAVSLFLVLVGSDFLLSV